MAIAPSVVSIIDNSETGAPDEYIVFLSNAANVEVVKAVPGCYGHTIQHVRHSTIVRGFIDMRYVSDEVEAALIDAAGLSAELGITLSVNEDSPYEEGTVIFTATVTNTGLLDATGVVAHFHIPTGLTYVIKSPAGGTTYDQDTGVWDIGAIEKDDNVVLTVTCTVDNETAGTAIDAGATITASTTLNYVTSDDLAAVTIFPREAHADLDFTFVADDMTPAVLGHVIFTVTITNNGPLDATGVMASVPIPTGMTYSAKTVEAGQTYVQGTGVWTVGALVADATKTLLVDVTVDAGQEGLTIEAGGQITGVDQLDDVPANYNDVVTLTVETEADPGITLTFDDVTPAQPHPSLE